MGVEAVEIFSWIPFSPGNGTQGHELGTRWEQVLENLPQEYFSLHPTPIYALYLVLLLKHMGISYANILAKTVLLIFG